MNHLKIDTVTLRCFCYEGGWGILQLRTFLQLQKTNSKVERSNIHLNQIISETTAMKQKLHINT